MNDPERDLRSGASLHPICTTLTKKCTAFQGAAVYLDMLSDIKLLNDVLNECKRQHEVAWILLAVQALNETKDKV